MTYLYPFPAGTRKSQEFGAFPNNGFNGPGGHPAIDWAVDEGTPIRAAADGVIELSSWVSENYQDNPWWLTQMGGDMLVLNCGSTRPTFIYAHLSNSVANVGDRVSKGQIIGYSGNTGTATTGPHTHVEALPPGYVLNSTTYGRVNPDVFLDEYWEEEDMANPVIDAVQAEAIAARAAELTLAKIVGVLKGRVELDKYQAEAIAARAAEIVRSDKK